MENGGESEVDDSLRRVLYDACGGALSDDSQSLSLPREAVHEFLCTSPSHVMPSMSASEVARNIDSQGALLEDGCDFQNAPNQIVVEDEEYFVEIPRGENSSAEGVADALVNRISFYPQVPTRGTYLDLDHNDEMISPPSCSSAGAFSFNIFIEPSTKRKTSEYIFKEEEDCLYAKPKEFVPFIVQCSPDPPPHASIRVCAYYAQGAHASQPVRRCPNHIADDETAHREHFIIAENPHANYIDAKNEQQRPHVMVPFPCSPGPPFIPLKFMCYSSCAGGINRRPTFLCFTLEANGETLGRRQMSLKVCACPSRDSASDGVEPTPKRRRTIVVPTEVVTTSTASSRNSFTEDDNTIYEVQVRGRHLYKLVCSIISSHELARRYSREVRTDDSNATVVPLSSNTRPLSQRTSISSWLAGLHLSKYESAFRANSLHIVGDLEGTINEKFLLSIGVSEENARELLTSYLSWFNVYNAERQSSLSSGEGTSFRVQRTRLRTTIRDPYEFDNLIAPRHKKDPEV